MFWGYQDPKDVNLYTPTVKDIAINHGNVFENNIPKLISS